MYLNRRHLNYIVLFIFSAAILLQFQNCGNAFKKPRVLQTGELSSLGDDESESPVDPDSFRLGLEAPQKSFAYLGDDITLKLFNFGTRTDLFVYELFCQKTTSSTPVRVQELNSNSLFYSIANIKFEDACIFYVTRTSPSGSIKTTNKLNLKVKARASGSTFYIDNLSNTILADFIENTLAWSNILNDTVNKDMGATGGKLGCLLAGTGCPPVSNINDKTTWHSIAMLRDQDNVLVANNNLSTTGFDINAEKCNGFDAVNGNDDCPFRVELKWAPICVNANCINPDIKIATKFIFKARTLSTSFNVEDYNSVVTYLFKDVAAAVHLSGNLSTVPIKIYQTTVSSSAYPSSITLGAGITATGTPPIAYNWYKVDDSGNKLSASLATTPTFTVTDSATAEGYYILEASNANGANVIKTNRAFIDRKRCQTQVINGSAIVTNSPACQPVCPSGFTLLNGKCGQGTISNSSGSSSIDCVSSTTLFSPIVASNNVPTIAPKTCTISLPANSTLARIDYALDLKVRNSAGQMVASCNNGSRVVGGGTGIYANHPLTTYALNLAAKQVTVNTGCNARFTYSYTTTVNTRQDSPTSIIDFDIQ